ISGFSAIHGRRAIHGTKDGALVHVGAAGEELDLKEVRALVNRCAGHEETHLQLLSWDWSPALDVAQARAYAQERGVKLGLFKIPREVMDGQAREKGSVRFLEVPLIEVAIQPLQAGVSKVGIVRFEFPCGGWIPQAVRSKITRWSDFIDSWSVDWD